jgi:hypothetical protein
LPERGSQKLLKPVTIAHTSKIVARILRGRTERKIYGVAGGYLFGFVRRKGIRDALEMLGIISERNLDIDEELCAWCMDWQNTIDRHQMYKTNEETKGNQNRLTRKKIDQQIADDFCRGHPVVL